MVNAQRYPAHICGCRVGLLQQVRQMADVQVKMRGLGHDFTAADDILNRMLLVCEVLQSPLGPQQHATAVGITRAEYEALHAMCGLARLDGVHRMMFDFARYLLTMRELCSAVGKDAALDWGTPA